jgi:hypothetical protein
MTLVPNKLRMRLQLWLKKVINRREDSISFFKKKIKSCNGFFFFLEEVGKHLRFVIKIFKRFAFSKND